jgi:hypothetical protein
MQTSEWLRALGAVRPMAVTDSDVLVLGACRDGYYPIHWERYNQVVDTTDEGKPIYKVFEVWRIFGLRVEGTLFEADCVRILSALEAPKGNT